MKLDRTKAWLARNEADLVGITEEALTGRADAAGIYVRVISKDGQGFALTADHRPDRINLELVDGRVRRIDGAY